MDPQTQIGIGAGALFAVLGLLAVVVTNRRLIYAMMVLCGIAAIWGLGPLLRSSQGQPATASVPQNIATGDCNVVGGQNSGTINQDCHKTINQTTPEPNALYQSGNKIGRVSSQRIIDDTTNTIRFQSVTLESGFDQNKSIKYGHLLLKCKGNSVSVSPDAMVGGIVSFPDFRCSIEGHE